MLVLHIEPHQQKSRDMTIMQRAEIIVSKQAQGSYAAALGAKPKPKAAPATKFIKIKERNQTTAWSDVEDQDHDESGMNIDSAQQAAEELDETAGDFSDDDNESAPAQDTSNAVQRWKTGNGLLPPPVPKKNPLMLRLEQMEKDRQEMQESAAKDKAEF
jgi:hypothetical protein